MKNPKTLFKLFLSLILIFLLQTKASAFLGDSLVPNKPKRPYPNCLLNLGAGLGHNFGIVGAQAVLGYMGNGILFSLGKFGELATYCYGVQFAEEWFYASFTRGVVGTATEGYSGKEFPLWGNTLMLGARINIQRAKKIYLQLGVGYTQASIWNAYGHFDHSGFATNAGIGFRLFNIKKTAGS